jgi:hypothetical protein
MKRTMLAAAAVGLLASMHVSAHHSYSDYHRDQLVEITGVVEGIKWASPHAIVSVRSSERLYTFEWQAPYSLARRGVTPDTIKVGDRVIVKGNPRRDIAESGILHLKDVERKSDGWGWGCGRVRPAQAGVPFGSNR